MLLSQSSYIIVLHYIYLLPTYFYLIHIILLLFLLCLCIHKSPILPYIYYFSLYFIVKASCVINSSRFLDTLIIVSLCVKVEISHMLAVLIFFFSSSYRPDDGFFKLKHVAYFTLYCELCMTI
jgi:hypothetical protein